MVMTRGSLQAIADVTNWTGGLLELKALVLGIGYSRHTFVGTPFVACAGGVKDIILGYLVVMCEDLTPDDRWHDRVMILFHLARGYVGHDWVLDREEMRVFMLELASGERVMDLELCEIYHHLHPYLVRTYLLGREHGRRGNEAPTTSQHVLDYLHRIYQY
jgi:hypothetical protein